MRKEGLVYNDIWARLRSRRPLETDCQLLAFLIQVAAGHSYRLMPTKLADEEYWVEDWPGQSICVSLSACSESTHTRDAEEGILDARLSPDNMCPTRSLPF